jgi:hypothetical protein
MAATDITWKKHIKVVEVVSSGTVVEIDEVNNTVKYFSSYENYPSTPISDGEVDGDDHKKIKDLKTSVGA